MTRLHRRILYLSFILLFLITTPIVLLTSAGFRYDFRRNEIYKTGLLVFKVMPRPDQVIVDGREYPIKSEEIRIGNLRPGDHDIQLKKFGYHDWKKIATVHAAQATVFEDVRIFQKSTPFILAKEIDTFSPSPNKKYFAFISKNRLQLILYETSRAKLSVLHEITEGTMEELAWSSDSRQIAIRVSKPSSLKLLELDQPETVSTVATAPLSVVTEMRWSTTRPNALFLSDGKKLFEVNLIQDSKIRDVGNAFDWYENEKALYLLRAASDGVQLIEVNRLGEEVELETFPLSLTTHFLPSGSDFLTMLDPEKNEIIVYNPSSRVISTFPHTSFGLWSDDSRQFIFGQDHEFSVLDTETDRVTILLRTSEVLNHPWIFRNGYLFMERDDQLTVFETLFGTPLNTQTLLEKKVHSVDISEDEKRLIVLSDDGTLLSLEL